MKKTVLLFLVLSTLSSCVVQQHSNSSKLFSKRKYRSGFHFNGFAKKNKSSFRKAPFIDNDNTITENISTQNTNDLVDKTIPNNTESLPQTKMEDL